MRTLPNFEKKTIRQIEEAWTQRQPDWARKRLLVVRLISQQEHTVAQIMNIAGVCRQTVFTYRDRVRDEGVKGLLHRKWAGARRPTLQGAVAEEFGRKLALGEFQGVKDALRWIKARTRKQLTENGVRRIIHRANGVHGVKKRHGQKSKAV